MEFEEIEKNDSVNVMIMKAMNNAQKSFDDTFSRDGIDQAYFELEMTGYSLDQDCITRSLKVLSTDHVIQAKPKILMQDQKYLSTMFSNMLSMLRNNNVLSQENVKEISKMLKC